MADLFCLLVVEHGHRVTVRSTERLAGPRPGATTQENCGGRDSATRLFRFRVCLSFGLAILLEKWSAKRLLGYECLAVEYKSLPKNGIFLLTYG